MFYVITMEFISFWWRQPRWPRLYCFSRKFTYNIRMSIYVTVLWCRWKTCGLRVCPDSVRSLDGVSRTSTPHYILLVLLLILPLLPHFPQPPPAPPPLLLHCVLTSSPLTSCRIHFDLTVQWPVGTVFCLLIMSSLLPYRSSFCFTPLISNDQRYHIHSIVALRPACGRKGTDY